MINVDIFPEYNNQCTGLFKCISNIYSFYMVVKSVIIRAKNWLISVQNNFF